MIVGPILQGGHITLVSFVVHIHRFDLKLFQFCLFIFGVSLEGGGQGNAADPLTYTGEERKLLCDRSFLLFPHEQMDPMVQVCL